MNVCVFGLWHLGSVTAACMAEHFPTVGLDPDAAVVAALREGRPPILEPGLPELVRAGLDAGRLTFTSELRSVTAADAGGRRVDFACSPENLRLGKALDVFRKPDRIVVGARTDAARARLGAL